MQSSITKIRNFEPDTLTYSSIATNKYGGKFLYVNHRTGRIFLQFPKMRMPFKVSEYVPKDEKTGQPTGEDSKYSISLSFYKMDENPKLKQAHDRLAETDEAIIDAAILNHEKWFPGQFNKYKKDPDKLRVAIETLYNSLLKQDSNGKYPPTIRIKLPRYDGVFKMEIYDQSNKSTPVKFGMNEDEGEVPITKYLNKGTFMTPVVSMPMINFMKGFGASFSMVQSIAKPASTFMGSCVIDDSDEEDADEDTSPAQQGNLIEDSDDEGGETNGGDNIVIDSDEDLPEPEPEPEPEPVKKKGRGRKKR